MLAERYKIPIYYCRYKGVEQIQDAQGRYTGEKRLLYYPPERMRVHVSAAEGRVVGYLFGVGVGYDRTMSTNDTSCPIDEHTVLFIDKEPDFNDKGLPLYNYIVKKVAKSKNLITYAIKRVDVG